MFVVNTISVFLHWFKPIASWMFLFVVSKIALLICPNLFFAGFMSLTVGLLLKFSLWSFRVIKLLFPPSISNGFSTSLFLKIFFPSILICFFMLLPVFFYFKVMAFFIIWLKCSTKHFSQNYCSQESGWLPCPVAHQITGHIDFMWKYFGTLMWSHIR